MDEPCFHILKASLFNPFELEFVGNRFEIGCAIVFENQGDKKLCNVVTLIGVVADGGQAVEPLPIFVVKDLCALLGIIGKIASEVVDIQSVHIVNIELLHQQPLFGNYPCEIW